MVSIDGVEINAATIDGGDVQEITVDGDVVWTASGIDVYLHDDFGDNNLTGRIGSNTGTYNGVGGVYRPEYTIDRGNPAVSNGSITWADQDFLYTGINLNLDETITWEITNFDVSNGGNGLGDIGSVSLFHESTARPGDYVRYANQAYSIGRRNEDNFVKLARNDSSSYGSVSTLISGNGFPDVVDITVTRSPSGTWEVFVDGTSIGTATDTTYTNPRYFGFASDPSNAFDGSVDEVRVY